MEERLRKFAFVVEAGSFTKAARELHVSQPALSASIAKLERELHASLLVHGSRPLELTAAGQLAYDTACQFAAQTKNLADQLSALERKQQKLGVGMIDSVASALFATADPLAALESTVNASLMVNNSRFLLEAVAAGDLAVAFIAAPDRRLPDGLATYFVGNEPLVLVCHTELVLKARSALAQGKLPHFIAYDRPSTTYRLIEEALRERGIATQISFSSTSPEVMLRLVMLKRGAAILPYLLVRDLLAAGTITLLGMPEPLLISRRISSVKLRAQPRNAAVDTLTKAVRQTLQALEVSARTECLPAHSAKQP